MGAITAEIVDMGEKRDGRGYRVVARAHRLAAERQLFGNDCAPAGDVGRAAAQPMSGDHQSARVALRWAAPD